MRVPQGGQDERDDLVDAASRRVDREVRPPVIGPARPGELLDLVAGSPVQHGPVTDPASPLEELAHVAVEPDHCAQLAEALHPPLAARQAPSGCDDVARLQRQRGERPGLELAEALLAASRKISGIDRPSRATIMSSVSTKQRPSRRATSRPQTDFPAPMNPTSITLSRRILASYQIGVAARTLRRARRTLADPRAAGRPRGWGPAARGASMNRGRSSGQAPGGKRSRASSIARTG